MDKVKVGVVGVGYLGSFHAEKYASLPDVELVGVVDIIKARADQIARQWNTRAYYHHHDLLDKVQAVSIAVPTPLHYAIARDFFQHGIDVLLEKPMTVTLKEAEGLLKMAEENKLIFQVGHLERFNAAIMALEGTLNEPMFIESHRLGPFPGRGTEVNVVLDLMIHDIDVILSLVKMPVEHIWAVGVPVISKTVDIANARLTFANGCVANVTASRVSRDKTRKIRIFQPDAYISIDYVRQQITILRRKKSNNELELPCIVEEKVQISQGDPLKKEIEAFVQAVRERTPPPVSGQDGKRALAVALEIEAEISNFAQAHWGRFSV